jgi:hypothetical protein
MHRLAFEFAKHIQPNRNLSSVATGLNLIVDQTGQTVCTKKQDRAAYTSGENEPRVDASQILSASSLASRLYVDYDKGDDNNTGSKAMPLKTVAAAVQKAPTLRAPRTIFLASSGTHYLDSGTVKLTPAHSNTTITSMDNNSSAVVSGGKVIQPKWAAYKSLNNSKGAVIGRFEAQSVQTV